MRTKWTILKLFLGIVIFIALVSFSAHRHANKDVQKINIQIDHESGRYFLDENLVLKIVEGKKINISQTTLGDLNIGVVESMINQNEFVKHSDVYKDVNGELFINITQQEPIARINTGVDEYYLNSDLQKMPLSTNFASEVLLIGGKIDESDYVNIKELVDYIMADKLLKKHIVAVKKIQPNSFNLLVNKGNYVIEFGQLTNIEEKFDNLKLFYHQYLGKVGVDYYQSINLKFNNQIVATKSNSDEQ